MTLRSVVFRRTLLLEGAGFLLIVAIIWMDEIMKSSTCRTCSLGRCRHPYDWEKGGWSRC